MLEIIGNAIQPARVTEMRVNDSLFRYHVTQIIQPARRARRAAGGVNNEIRRNLSAIFDLRQERRNSNVDVFDFDANVVSLGIQARF